jgi:hypothetical protein
MMPTPMAPCLLPLGAGVGRRQGPRTTTARLQTTARGGWNLAERASSAAGGARSRGSGRYDAGELGHPRPSQLGHFGPSGTPRPSTATSAASHGSSAQQGNKRTVLSNVLTEDRQASSYR